jgi:pilus assembly protein CpaE
LISVVGAGGGNGASTVAANLAVALCGKHRECALFDLSLSSGVLASLLDLEPAHTLADHCHHAKRMDKTLLLRSLAKHSSGVHLLAAPASYRDLNAVTSQGVRKALGLARSHFRYVVVDHGCPYRAEQLQVLYQADIILIVMRLDVATVRHAQELISFLDENRISRDRLRLVVSQYRRPHELRIADVEKVLGMRACQLIPDDMRSVNRANNCGVPLVLSSPRARVARSIVNLSYSVNGSPEHEPSVASVKGGNE